MDRVGLRGLQQNLSAYLGRVLRGEVATAGDGLARLEARKIPVRRGLGNLADLPPPAKVELERPLRDALDVLGEDRA